MPPWLAALLTAMARLLIDGPVPLFLFEANVSGAGKTLLCDLIAIIVTGRPMTRTGYAHDPVEMGKQISATALAGDALVLFDNLANGGLFGNPALDRALTGRTCATASWASSTTPNLDLIAVFFASGNNTALCSDVARRIVQNRLECPHEHPEERTGFQIPDLLGHAAEHRGGLVIAVLTILRAYILAGKPGQGLTPMDFVAWSGLIRNAVHWSTGIDPCADHHEWRISYPSAVSPPLWSKRGVSCNSKQAARDSPSPKCSACWERTRTACDTTRFAMRSLNCRREPSRGSFPLPGQSAKRSRQSAAKSLATNGL